MAGGKVEVEKSMSLGHHVYEVRTWPTFAE